MKSVPFTKEEQVLVDEFKRQFPILSGLLLFGEAPQQKVVGNAFNEIGRFWLDKLNKSL